MSPLVLLKLQFANDFYSFFGVDFFYLGEKNVIKYFINYYNKFNFRRRF